MSQILGSVERAETVVWVTNHAWKIVQGDALDVLRSLPDGHVQTVVTSPPYWGLRDYGVEGQLGLEANPEEYVTKLVGVFEEVRRVLRDDGTLWLVLGDTYANDSKWGGHSGNKNENSVAGGYQAVRAIHRRTGLPGKSMVGIPWRVAFALQAAGWILRRDIIWNKSNGKSENVHDRPTGIHEYIFLLSKKPKYYYDDVAIREDAMGGRQSARGASFRREDSKGAHVHPGQTMGTHRPDRDDVAYNGETRNKRSVWTIPTHGFPEAHFATFPPKLVEPCILAGAPEGGLVLDPFTGSGTVGLVALRHHRRFLGIELNADYCEMARRRIVDDAPLLNSPNEGLAP